MYPVESPVIDFRSTCQKPELYRGTELIDLLHLGYILMVMYSLIARDAECNSNTVLPEMAMLKRVQRHSYAVVC